MTTTCERFHFERQDWNSSRENEEATKRHLNPEIHIRLNMGRTNQKDRKGWKIIYWTEIFQKDKTLYQKKGGRYYFYEH